jgi:hypothetical protein
MKYEMLLSIISLILVGGITCVFAEFNASTNVLDASYGNAAGRYVVEEIEGEQIVRTDLGNIDVLLAPSPSVPQPKQFTNLHIVFLIPNTRTLINEVDYKVLVLKDDKEVYSTPGITFTYSGFDDVSFYIDAKGKYLVSVSVVGVNEEDIPRYTADRNFPVETANFTLIVGEMDEEKSSESSQPSQKTEKSEYDAIKIPDWFRKTAKWWSLTQISDNDFASGIEYLFKQKVIQIPDTIPAEHGAYEKNLPGWLRKDAGWWSQGLLSDEEFAKSLKWLIINGFIKI